MNNKDYLKIVSIVNSFVFDLKRKWNINTEKIVDLPSFLKKIHLNLKYEENSLYKSNSFSIQESKHKITIISYNEAGNHTPEYNWLLGQTVSQVLLLEFERVQYDNYQLLKTKYHIDDDSIQEFINFFLLMPPLLYNKIFLSNYVQISQNNAKIYYENIAKYFNVPLKYVIDYSKVLQLV